MKFEIQEFSLKKVHLKMSSTKMVDDMTLYSSHIYICLSVNKPTSATMCVLYLFDIPTLQYYYNKIVARSGSINRLNIFLMTKTMFVTDN